MVIVCSRLPYWLTSQLGKLMPEPIQMIPPLFSAQTQMKDHVA